MYLVEMIRAVPSAPQHAEQALAQLEGGKVAGGSAVEKADARPDVGRGEESRGVRRELAAAGMRGEGAGKDRQEELADQIKQATEVAEFLNRSLSFEVDPDIGRVVISVIERDTGKVIRKIPPEEMVKVLKRLHQVRGIILDAEG